MRLYRFVKYVNNDKDRFEANVKIPDAGEAERFSLVLDHKKHAGGGMWREYSGGQLPDVQREHFPELSGVAELHLCDSDGYPMHVIDNGIYWLAGALGGMGERYHGGNGYSAKSPGECSEYLRSHLRLSELECIALIEHCASKPEQWKELFRESVHARKAQWRDEADAVRRYFNAKHMDKRIV